MLRESGNKQNQQFNFTGVTDILVDTGVDGAGEIIALTDAVVLGDSDELEIARSALSDHLGVAGTVRVIAVAANFMMMNIIMDTLGTTPRENFALLARELGFAAHS